MEEVGRNRYILQLEVELTLPVPNASAEAAGDLLADDIAEFLRRNEWGWGRARVEGVYAPKRQFQHGDFVPENV